MRHLTVGAEQWVPWLRIEENGDDGGLVYSGIMYNILIALSRAMNFTYELRRPVDGLWGVGYPNGSWVGMLGMVKRGEVDFALGPFAFNWERYHFACEFTQPIFIDYESVFMRRPRVETDLFAFVRPFTWQVWLCLIGVIPLTWFILVLFLYLSPDNTMAMQEDKAKRTRRNSKCLVSVVPVSDSSCHVNVVPVSDSSCHVNVVPVSDSCCQEPECLVSVVLVRDSSSHEPDSDSRRVMAATWLLATLILLSLFSGTLIAMLTVPLVRLPIDSTEDLVNQDDIPWAIESGSFLYQILYQATGGIYKALWDGHSERITDCYSFREDIKGGKYAAVCDKMTMKKVMSEDYSASGECNYYMAREDFKSMPLALGFQHNHSLYAEANEQILRMLNMGLIDQWIDQQIPNGTACTGPPGSGTAGRKRPLSLQDYYGVFTLFGVGEGPV
ncbi:glutamate receptor ionotropic, delta-1-like [Penaeus chinensis]|uniref:glutamate receptor ionotropic, delta-1-like n=1 Tax=Penaeus chinensis TaxID=139456 RepID=UPI001FB5E9B3|nr:glutamate receptor ionotropic, delta-1-like [Penaeus chinensis]